MFRGQDVEVGEEARLVNLQQERRERTDVCCNTRHNIYKQFIFISFLLKEEDNCYLVLRFVLIKDNIATTVQQSLLSKQLTVLAQDR